VDNALTPASATIRYPASGIRLSPAWIFFRTFTTRYSFQMDMTVPAVRTRPVFFRLALLCLFICSWLIPSRTAAQFYNGSQLTFGKNRVQYNDFFWTYFRFDKFDTYFYLNGKELATFCAEYADQHLREIELDLQSPLEQKIQFIIFNTLSDLKQSNIGLYGDWDYYNTGGVTRIIGGKVLLFFDGDLGHFEQQIRAGIAQVILNQMMYGTGIGAQIKNNALFTMPEWYMNGLISYISQGWNTEIDNIVRDAVLSGKYNRFSSLTGEGATYAGHSLWHYIALKYGESSIPNIVYMSRLSRNIEKGFLYVLNMDYTTLVQDWQQYYKDLYGAQDFARSAPPDPPLNKKKKPDRTYTQIRVAPDQRHVAYCYQELGVYKVYITDIETGKTRRVYRGGYRLADRPDFTFPVLAWHPSGNILAILTQRKGETYLYFYDRVNKKSEFQILYNFRKITDMAYSDDGLLLVFSAYQKGQSDIFVYNIAAGSQEQITNDLYNDLNPRFVNNSRDIIFASNRTSDTLRFYENPDIRTMTFTNDIFIYHYRAKSPLLTRITNTPLADEIQPMPYADGYLSYLSNQNGIYNRFLAKFDSTISFVDTATHYRYFTKAFPVTDYNRSILQQDISVMGGKIGEIVYTKSNYRIFLSDLVRPAYATATQLMPTAFRTAQQKEAEILEEQKKNDTTQHGGEEGKKPGKKHFTTVKVGDVAKEIGRNIPVDTSRTYTTRPGGSRSSVFADTSALLKALRTPVKDTANKYRNAKQLNYNVEFSVDQTVTQIDFNYLNTAYQPFTGAVAPIFINPGLNLLFMVGVTDLMEDYRISGGVRLNFDLVNNEYLLSYSNNRRRLDQQIVFHRLGVDDLGLYSYVRHKINELHYIVTYPFTPVLNLQGTASVRYDRAVFLATDQINLATPDINTVWGVLKGTLTYDNTRNIGLNLYNGTRYKIWGEYYQLMENKANNVFVFGFDFRNYQKVHRTLIWANRLAGSTSFGSNKLLYYMGGVDNWLWPRFDINTPVAFNEGYVFQTLATPVRGFSQNIRNGNSFIVLNSELRWPVFRYLFNRPIRSGFLNNFQIVAFGDVGTAWTGPTPYSEQNQLFTYYIYRKPMYIKVQMLKDPLVGGFGTGVRTRILGYFIRGDVAWGVEDGVIRPAVFYLSLSLDF
jgi:WD40 repeat protein